MPIKGSNKLVRSHSYLYVFCLLLPLATLALKNYDGSRVIMWLLVFINYAIWLVLSSTCHFLTDNSLQSADKDQTPTRNACCGRETARCRSKIRYVSKSTVASRGAPYDSTALVNKSIPSVLQSFSVDVWKTNLMAWIMSAIHKLTTVAYAWLIIKSQLNYMVFILSHFPVFFTICG